MKSRHLLILSAASTLALVTPAGGSSTQAALNGAAGVAAESRAPTLRSPIRLAQLNNGHLLIADHYQERIIEVKPRSMAEVKAFPIEGKPLAVAYQKNRIFVGNETLQRVEVYDREGQKLYDLGGADGEILKPNDIDIDNEHGRVFVVDSLSAKIKIFDISSDPTGVLVGTIPPAGSTTNSLIHPTALVVDPSTSQVLVSDFGDPNLFVDPAVLVFDYQGTLINTISGSSGMLGERFSRPQGLALRGNRIYLVDSWAGRVFILERLTGITLASLGEYGSGPGQLNLPIDLLLDKNSDDVFVTNYQNRRIERFVNGAMVP